MHGIGKFLQARTKERENHPALQVADVVPFIQALRSRSRVAPVTRAAVEFQMLTAARPGEAMGARWSEINMAAKVWTIPAGRMKQGFEHSVSLSDAAMAILEGAFQSRQSDGLVFLTDKGKALHANSLNNLVSNMGFTDKAGRPASAHGLRSTFRDWAGDNTSVDNETIEFCLAHKLKDSTEAAYRRSTNPARRAGLMQAWADYATGKAAPAVIDLAAHRKAG